MRRLSMSAEEIAETENIPEARIIAFIEAGDLRAEWTESYYGGAGWWRVPVVELPVLHALMEGKTREEAQAERDEILAHIGRRPMHTPVGSKVTAEEMERRRLRQANG